jgi:putative glycosyltransferase (TIGR04348 family)
MCDSLNVKSKVVIVSPANAKSNNGNWHTAYRWARMLSRDYAVKIVEHWSRGDPVPDVMIALHARRSAQSMIEYRTQRKQGGLILALTGTDVYRDIHEIDAAQFSLEIADRMIVLQEAALEELSSVQRKKTEVIFQSAKFLKHAERYRSVFEIVQAGHLRHEKDPFTPITALRYIDPESRIRLTHVGKTLDKQHEDTMKAVVRDEPRLRWLGGVAHTEARQRIKRAHLLVLASKMEGGANVVVEAITAGVPVIASRISGNRGMLGNDYLGYFSFGDAKACAKLMARAESDANFYKQLTRACAKRAQLFAPHREQAAIRAIVRKVI